MIDTQDSASSIYPIDIVIMAGGKGSRLGGLEKPLLKICGERIIDHVIREVKKIRHRRIIICTRKELFNELLSLASRCVEVIECPGKDYVEDLNYVFTKINFPALILPSDMPFITSRVIEKFLREAFSTRSDVITLMRCDKTRCVETGISLFNKSGGEWSNIFFNDIPELRDIDTPEDLLWAERQCVSMGELEKQK